MTATVSTSLTIPQQQALPGAPIKADQTENQGAHAVVRTIQSLYAHKGGALICDMFQGTGNFTGSDARQYRFRTPIYGNLTTGTAKAKLYFFRRRTNSGSWQLSISVNGVFQTLFNVSSGTGDVLELIGEFNLDDNAETNDISVTVSTYAGTLAAGQDYGLGFYAFHSYNGSSLPQIAGGYNRSVIPIDEDAIDLHGGAAVPWWVYLKSTAEDVYKRRVPMLYTSSFAYTQTSTLETVTILHPRIPKDVSRLKFYFRVTFFGLAGAATIELHYSDEVVDHDSSADETIWLEMDLDLDTNDRDPYIVVKSQRATINYMGVACDTASLPA